MKVRTFAVAGLQLGFNAYDNVAAIGAEVAAVKRRLPWVDMIVLPELAAYGPKTDRAEAPEGPAESAYRLMARENQVWLLPGSIFQKHDGHTFNVAPVIDPDGEIVARYRKMFPFRPYEEGVACGEEFCVVPIEGVGRIGICICYDLWFPEISRSLTWLGAEVLLCPSLTNTIDRDVELAMARAGSAGNQCYVVNVNAASPVGMGKSIVCGPGGEIVYQAGSDHEVFACELDLDHEARIRERGWHGLGQPLKSFRDSNVAFPPYQPGARSASLDALGPIAKIAKPLSKEPKP